VERGRVGPVDRKHQKKRVREGKKEGEGGIEKEGESDLSDQQALLQIQQQLQLLKLKVKEQLC